MSKSKKTLIALLVLIVLAVAAFFLWKSTQQAPETGSKTVTVEVIHGDGSQKEFVVKTDEEYLRGVLEQENLAQGDESEYGLFVKTVDGETVDESQQQWWCVTKSGGQVDTGVDTTPVFDGDVYEFTLTTGW